MSAQGSKAPMWFIIIAGLALVWNLAGVGAYISQMTTTDQALAAMETAERALYENYPAWAAGAFAVAVFGGALGSLLLLLRKRIATPVLAVSFAGIAIQMIHTFVISNALAVYGAGAAVMPVMVIAIGIGLVSLSMHGKNNGWLV